MRDLWRRDAACMELRRGADKLVCCRVELVSHRECTHGLGFGVLGYGLFQGCTSQPSRMYSWFGVMVYGRVALESHRICNPAFVHEYQRLDTTKARNIIAIVHLMMYKSTIDPQPRRITSRAFNHGCMHNGRAWCVIMGRIR
jgi:hypothetical protein